MCAVDGIPRIPSVLPAWAVPFNRRANQRAAS
jgi:hypothetical protein